MTSSADAVEIRPQPGPQETFLSTAADIAIYGGSAGAGKRLASTTLIPVPLHVDSTGYKQHGALTPGDYVFAPSGLPVLVTHVHPVVEDTDAYTVCFDTGEEIVADGDHLWHTMTESDRLRAGKVSEEWRALRKSKRPSRAKADSKKPWVSTSITRINRERAYDIAAVTGGVRTTRELALTLRSSRGALNHSIEVTHPLQQPDAVLPIDPYLFGLWLGDGYSHGGYVGMMLSDWVCIEQHVPPPASESIKTENYTQPFSMRRFDGMTTSLRALGVRKNKHIPPMYLRASYAQRLALFQGMMDTDGYCNKGGSCGLGFSNKRLAEDALELLCSLGGKGTLRRKRPKKGDDHWRFNFTASFNCFRLPRKAARQPTVQRGTTRRRFITAVRKVPSVPMRCITVADPSGLYLVGRTFIATHNTYAELLEPLRHITTTPGFGAVVFRRTSPQIRNEGGLWDESAKIYPFIGARPKESSLEWIFPPFDNRIKFQHLEHDKNIHDHQGAQYPLIEFDELTHFCLTPDHDVLTARGWVNIADVTCDDEVAALTDARDIVWTSVVDTPAFHFSGELVTVAQRNGVSLRMTPNHRCVIDRQDRAESLGFVVASKLLSTVQTIPRVGSYQGGKDVRAVALTAPRGRGHGTNSNAASSCDMDSYLEFLGWFVSEGSAFIQGKDRGRSSPVVSIRQTKSAPDLDALMKRLPWRARSDGDGGYRIFSRQLFDMVAECGKGAHNKRIPAWVLQLGVRQMRIFFDAFVRGDGHVTRTGGIVIGVASKGLRDDVHAMAALLGLIGTSRDGVASDGVHAVYTLSISKLSRSSTMVKPEAVKAEKYVGAVHCLTLSEHHRFMVRHNGRTCWTGNSESQFFYLLGRNRSMCGVRPYLRATTNPDPDSWVRTFIAWWIGEDGFPIPERSGVLRWFVRINDDLHWADSKKELLERFAAHGLTDDDVLSVTFIAATIYDNKELLKKDPGYLAKLRALPRVERERLLGGNWDARAKAGSVFARTDFDIVPAAPIDYPQRCRAWDLAATPGGGDWTAGVLFCRGLDKRWYIEEVVRVQASASDVRKLLKNVASQDGRETIIRLPQDPGQAGKAQAQDLAQMLSGYTVRFRPVTGSKYTRAQPLAAQAQAGNVSLVAGPWNKAFLTEAENFDGTDGCTDDQIDAASDAFNELSGVGVASEPRLRVL